jgi:hypothetical protein
MYVPEESQGGIVPMNYSNKDKIPSAESGEGRPSIKENARQPNTYPTQSGKGVSQGLAGVRKAARENKEMKFTALLHHPPAANESSFLQTAVSDAPSTQPTPASRPWGASDTALTLLGNRACFRVGQA